MEALTTLINLFLGLQGFAFVVYLFLSGTVVKNLILRIKTTEGELTYDDERGDMGVKSAYMGPSALLCLVFFYRPIFYYKMGRKVKSVYGVDKTKLIDLFGIWLPIALTVLILIPVSLILGENLTKYAVYETLIYIPIMACEIVAAIILSSASKKNFVSPDVRLSDN